jgi:hypothetical protein
MTAHELARKLLEGPDLNVVYPYEFNEVIGRHHYDTVDISNVLEVPVMNDEGNHEPATAVVLI